MSAADTDTTSWAELLAQTVERLRAAGGENASNEARWIVDR